MKTDLLQHSSFSLHPFFSRFDQFADAPDAVAKMRELVRTLAANGRLFGETESRECPTVRMKDVCAQITDGEHATPHRISSGVPLATAKNVRDGFLDLTNTDYVAQTTAEKCWRRCKPQHDDILMVCVGATTGRVCLAQNPPDIVLVRSVALIRPKLERIAPAFLDLFLRSSSGQAQIWGNVKQSAQPCLYLGKMAEFEICLPPLADSSYHTSQRSAEVAGSRFLIVWQAEIAGEIWKSLVDRVGRGVNDLESDASGRGVGC